MLNLNSEILKQDFHYVFGSRSDEEWLEMLKRSVAEPIIDGVKFPKFPDAVLQSNFVGSANSSALQEAYNFYTVLKSRSANLNIPLEHTSRILDFGCGWGRFLRFFCKDVDSRNLCGVDIDPNIIAVCENTGVPGTFSILENYKRLPFPDGYFSHVMAYSVFTHLPERAHLHWLDELARVMSPGATFSLTLEPRRFLDFVAGLKHTAPASVWHAALARFAEFAPRYRQSFDAGELVYLPTGGGEYRHEDVYGEAVVPLSYVEKNWSKYFNIIDYIDDPDRFWQAVLIVQRR